MPAWTHANTWNGTFYHAYRNFVAATAPTLKGEEEDCADLSLRMLVDFAEGNCLCLTLKDRRGVYYISKASGQIGDAAFLGDALAWSNKNEYYAAIKRRIGAQGLYESNTFGVASGPQPGDLMISPGHAALVFAYYPPAVLHPKAADTSVADFPADPDDAAKQLTTLEYIKSRTLNGHAHIDYLNHRGKGKVKAELIFFADVENTKSFGFEYRKYHPRVTENWTGWSGTGVPPDPY